MTDVIILTEVDTLGEYSQRNSSAAYSLPISSQDHSIRNKGGYKTGTIPDLFHKMQLSKTRNDSNMPSTKGIPENLEYLRNDGNNCTKCAIGPSCCQNLQSNDAMVGLKYPTITMTQIGAYPITDCTYQCERGVVLPKWKNRNYNDC